MFPGKKKTLSQFMMSTGLSRVADSFSAPSLTVFNFHRIRLELDSPASHYDDDVFGPSAEEFRAHMRWLSTHSTVLSEDDLLSSLHKGRPLPRRSVMITFDDGYVDNYELALPILKELNVPATFFIPTQAIEEGALGWWDLIAYVLKKTKCSVIDFRGEKYSVSEGQTPRRLLVTHFQQMMKLNRASENQTLVDELALACGVALPCSVTSGREVMTWDQVREVAASGVVTIGSHTCSHRVLATLDFETQVDELRRSKQELEAQIKKPVRLLSYPVGGYEHFNLETKQIAKECGYEAAFSFHTGINRLDGSALDPFDIRRLSAPETTSLYSATLTLPLLYGQRRCEAAAPVAI